LGSFRSCHGAYRHGSIPDVRLPDQSASCVGFAQLVGQPADDRNGRKGVAFGYFCQDETRPMSTETAEDLIGKVSLSGRR
jgi:hypothetical protein